MPAKSSARAATLWADLPNVASDPRLTELDGKVIELHAERKSLLENLNKARQVINDGPSAAHTAALELLDGAREKPAAGPTVHQLQARLDTVVEAIGIAQTRRTKLHESISAEHAGPVREMQLRAIKAVARATQELLDAVQAEAEFKANCRERGFTESAFHRVSVTGLVSRELAGLRRFLTIAAENGIEL